MSAPEHNPSNITFTATYSPDDNKLRLYATRRLDKPTYERLRAAGFAWAPKQELFVASMWTPGRADLCLELAGEIGDEDTSLVERAEDRAGRFDEYSDKRRRESNATAESVRRIADNIPLGQPILVGHHSEKHARKDAARIEAGMRRAIDLWDTAKYWQERATGALHHAKYKERPDVRARRIKGIEKDERKQRGIIARSELLLKTWRDPLAQVRRKDGSPCTLRDAVLFLANRDSGYFSARFKRASGYEGPINALGSRRWQHRQRRPRKPRRRNSRGDLRQSDREPYGHHRPRDPLARSLHKPTELRTRNACRQWRHSSR